VFAANPIPATADSRTAKYFEAPVFFERVAFFKSYDLLLFPNYSKWWRDLAVTAGCQTVTNHHVRAKHRPICPAALVVGIKQQQQFVKRITRPNGWHKRRLFHETVRRIKPGFILRYASVR
jgi:hypothetical protein